MLGEVYKHFLYQWPVRCKCQCNIQASHCHTGWWSHLQSERASGGLVGPWGFQRVLLVAPTPSRLHDSLVLGTGHCSHGLFQARPMLYEQQHIFLVMLKASSPSQVPFSEWKCRKHRLFLMSGVKRQKENNQTRRHADAVNTDDFLRPSTAAPAYKYGVQTDWSWFEERPSYPCSCSHRWPACSPVGRCKCSFQRCCNTGPVHRSLVSRIHQHLWQQSFILYTADQAW